VRVSIDSSEGRHVTTADVWAKETTPLEVPTRAIDTMESIALGFRMDMFDLTDSQGNGGSMATGSGLGSDAIHLEYKKGKDERKIVIKGTDLLIAWVKTFDPQMAEDMARALSPESQKDSNRKDQDA